MIGEIRCYTDLQMVLRARAAEVGLTREALDFVSGLSRGHSGKLLGPGQVKKFGPTSLDVLLSALGLKLVAVNDDDALERFGPMVDKYQSVRPRHFDLAPEVERLARELVRDRAAKAGRRGARIRLAGTSPEQRSRSASIAGQARWAKGVAPQQRQRLIAGLNAARKRKKQK